MNIGSVSLSKNPILRFLPAILMMLAIFLFSAGRAIETPQQLLGFFINKGGHMVGYAILALAYWRMLEFKRNRVWIAWFLALLYAFTDEYHQSLVPWRHPRLFDVLVFDNLGALISLWLAGYLIKSKQPGTRKDRKSVV